MCGVSCILLSMCPIEVSVLTENTRETENNRQKLIFCTRLVCRGYMGVELVARMAT
jgi:hypothetical protein